MELIIPVVDEKYAPALFRISLCAKAVVHGGL